MSRKVVEIAGKRLSLSNLEKDLYPSYGFTKAHILEYYRRIATFILPHLKDRALTLKRYPEGVEKDFFFEKRCPSHRPAWVKTAEIPQDDGERMTVCLVNDLETLIWVENLASLELHVPLARADSPETPDSMVFDLDPGDQADILDCARVALILRDLLSQLRLASYVKTSGKKGLHVYVPLNRKETTFEDTKKFSKAVAEVLQTQLSGPGDRKNGEGVAERKGLHQLVSERLLKDDDLRLFPAGPGKTDRFVSPCMEGTGEFGRAGRSGKAAGHAFGSREQGRKKGDLFREVLVKKQKLPHL